MYCKVNNTVLFLLKTLHILLCSEECEVGRSWLPQLQFQMPIIADLTLVKFTHFWVHCEDLCSLGQMSSCFFCRHF